MHKPLLCSSLLLLLAGLAHGQEKPKLINDTWNAAFVEGTRAGYFHSTTYQTERDGQKLFSTNLEMNLKVKRYGEVVNLRMETGDEETPDGKIVAVSLTQFTDKGGKQVLKARVQDNRLLLRVGVNPREFPFPWNDKAVGTYKAEQLFKERKLKPGDSYDYLSFELSVQSAVQVKVKARDFEEVDVLEVANPNAPNPAVTRIKKKLLSVDIQPGKVKVQGNEIQLPKLTSWLDSEYVPVRSQTELPGLGLVTMYRTTEAVARLEPDPRLMPDLGVASLIKLDKPLNGIHNSTSAVYSITIKDDDDPTTIFTQDSRQKVLNKNGRSFELAVKAIRRPEAKKSDETRAELLKSSFFLDSDNPKVKRLAAKIVGDETDPWQKGLKIEEWVHDHMKSDAGIGYVTASQIATELRGDCRQHGMLTAALCRSAGIPSRTALGLVYGQDRRHGPLLGFHLWTEVWIKGQWLALDATLGQGGIGPGHLKITDHDWNDAHSLAPLLPIVRAIGQIKIDSVKFE